MVFILIGSFFLLNLFIGVISLSYHLATEKAKNIYLTDDQSNWIEIQRLIINARPFFPNQFPPQNRIRALAFRILKSPAFDPFVMLCIIVNIITLSMAYETSATEYDTVLSNLNLAFTAVFIWEAIIKLTAYGIEGYFNNSWNNFDFFVVVASIIDFSMDSLGTSLKGLKIGP
jgi:hypothetical protein